MQGGGIKIDDHGVPIADFAPHMKYRGRRRGWHLFSSDEKYLSQEMEQNKIITPDGAWATSVTKVVKGSHEDSARKNLFRNDFPTYQRANAYYTTKNKGYNQNFFTVKGYEQVFIGTVTIPHYATNVLMHGSYIFHNPDYYPQIQHVQGGGTAGFSPSPTTAVEWDIVFPRGRAVIATNNEWGNESEATLPPYIEAEIGPGQEAGLAPEKQFELGDGWVWNLGDGFAASYWYDTPIRKEYLYAGVSPAVVKALDDPFNNTTKLWKETHESYSPTGHGAIQISQVGPDIMSVLHLYSNKWHMHYVFFGDSTVDQKLPGFEENPLGHDLTPTMLAESIANDNNVWPLLDEEAKQYVFQSDGFTEHSQMAEDMALMEEQGFIPFFKTSEKFVDLSFISHVPYSLPMAHAAGLSTNYLLVANIESHFEFSSKQYDKGLETETLPGVPGYEEKFMPNFYSFLSLLNSKPNMLAEGSVVFNEAWGDTALGGHNDQMTLGGLIDPNQIPLVNQVYSDYQAFSQLPHGHANWNNNANAWFGEPYYGVAQFDYWHAYGLNYPEFLKAEKANLRQMMGQKNTNIVFPYESTKYLVDYNEKITLFPHHVKLEIPYSGHKPLLPALLKQARADKYFMRAIIANAWPNRWGTNGYPGMLTDLEGANIQHPADRNVCSYRVAFEHPPGEKSSLDNLETIQGSKNLIYGNVHQPYNQPSNEDKEELKDTFNTLDSVPTWDVLNILNHFKIGSPGPFLSGIGFATVDTQFCNFIGTDKELGWPYNDDLSADSANIQFTKSIYSYVLEKKLRSLSAQKMRSIGSIMNGDTCYSEIVMFRILKYPIDPIQGAPGPYEDPPLATDPYPPGAQNIWIWNTGQLDALTYLDTQVKAGRPYKYAVYAYYFVIGNEYVYADNNKSALPKYLGGVGEMSAQYNTGKLVKEIQVNNSPVLKIIEVPYFGFEEQSSHMSVAMDKPPVPPDPVFIPYRNTADRINITIRTNSGEYSTNKLYHLLDGDEKKWEAIKISQKAMSIDEGPFVMGLPSGPTLVETSIRPITFKSDTHPTSYEVYRIGPDSETGITKPPASYTDFYNKLHKVIDIDGSSMSFDDNIQPNKEYYYIFRSTEAREKEFFLGKWDLISNPTAVFKVELVKEIGKQVVYPMISVYDMSKTNVRRAPSKTMKRFMHIKPRYEHTLVNEDSTGYLGVESAKLSNKSLGEWVAVEALGAGNSIDGAFEIPMMMGGDDTTGGLFMMGGGLGDDFQMSTGVKLAPYRPPTLGVNEDSYELFHFLGVQENKFDAEEKNLANRFKIRLTSKSSGRKIDVNVSFLHKHDE